ncbi:hypothetical protein A3D70_01560 [Candidatus Adlerbacteria bacterium RIFCSPHIGHO2_02_FULL_54_18]|uniref:Uncharacterized protein n=2 Tax=Candidatus Adleribacteriota TaxID=1752736 RepID=A0A1F4Y440_9BACT|nr:MAG: hypothetical protein A3D70_01560 [Candidatus Adlerbacteria bacterium RIFCSPHIGHO2_02_FULL_54_18]
MEKDTKQILELMVERFDQVDKELKDIKKSQGHMEQDILVMKEDVDAIAKTVSRDARTLITHGRRITRLERSQY